VYAISAFIARGLDLGLIDGIIHTLAWIARGAAVAVSVIGDKWFIDNGVDTFAEKTWDLGLRLRSIQTGQLRQYVMFIVICTIALFLIATGWTWVMAG
jgi:hypothetical protein